MLSRLFVKILYLPTFVSNRFYKKINGWYFRAKGVEYGNNFNVTGKVVISGFGKIKIGDRFCMTSGGDINPICGDCKAIFFTETKDSCINIGNRVGMSSTRMWIHDKLIVGNNVHIGANVLLIDTDTHQIDYKLRRDPDDAVFSGLSETEIWEMKRAHTKSAPIVIEDDVWIGAHCIVLKGVTIGARSVIGAGSVVTKNIPADCVAAGNPCKVIKKLI